MPRRSLVSSPASRSFFRWWETVGWAELHLQPLADALGDKVRYNATVTGVARAGRDRVVGSGREDPPFTVHVATADGSEERITAAASSNPAAPRLITLGAAPESSC